MTTFIPTACNRKFCRSYYTQNCTSLSFSPSCTPSLAVHSLTVRKLSRFKLRKWNTGHHTGIEKEAIHLCLLVKQRPLEMRIQAMWCFSRAWRTFLPCYRSHFMVWKGHKANVWARSLFSPSSTNWECKLMHFPWLLQRSSRIPSLSEQALAKSAFILLL